MLETNLQALQAWTRVCDAKRVKGIPVADETHCIPSARNPCRHHNLLNCHRTLRRVGVQWADPYKHVIIAGVGDTWDEALAKGEEWLADLAGEGSLS